MTHHFGDHLMSHHHLIIFDGVCLFCNGAINFIIKRDPGEQFLFVPLQSPAAKYLIEQHQAEKVGFDTFLLIKNGRCFYRTNAAFEISRDLSGGWFLWRIFRVIPRPVRDCFYRLFARNRYRLFGRIDQCMVPSTALKSRFLWAVSDITARAE